MLQKTGFLTETSLARLEVRDIWENAHEGRNIFCIYRLVQTSEWAEECGKIWVLLFQSMLEINEIWYIIIIYNILSAQISSSPRAGRETFTNPNFPLRPPGPQIA